MRAVCFKYIFPLSANSSSTDKYRHFRPSTSGSVSGCVFRLIDALGVRKCNKVFEMLIKAYGVSAMQE